jgi:hypothetical protein
MAKKARSRWYTVAKLFAFVFVVLLGLYFFAPIPGGAPGGSCDSNGLCAQVVDTSGLLLGLGALCFTGIGTISSVILGWRSERRQSAESTLKIAQLEIQLAQARSEAGKVD